MEDIKYSAVKSISFVVTGDPVPQGRPKFSSISHTARDPKKSRDYKALVSEVARVAALEQEWEIAPKSMPCRIEINIFKPVAKSLNKWKRQGMLQGYIPPTNKTGDIENIEKGIMDACAGIIYYDDCQVFGSHCEMRYSDNPRVEVTIHAYFVDMGVVRDTCLAEIYSAPRPYRLKENKKEV